MGTAFCMTILYGVLSGASRFSMSIISSVGEISSAQNSRQCGTNGHTNGLIRQYFR